MFLVLTGCWRDTAQLDQVVWADDGDALLIVELRFDERGSFGSGTTNKRDFRHQLLLADPDGEGREPIGDEVELQNAADVYFMRSTGTIVTGRLDGGGRTSWWLTDLTGDAREIPAFNDGDAGFVVPSPDGLRLAQVTSDGSRLRFLALDLNVVGTPVDLVPNAEDWTWRPDGNFVTTHPILTTSWDLAGGFVDNEVPGCTWPKTTSSPVDADGVRVWAADGELRFDAADPSLAFGCQSVEGG